jgi:hypothetical protein
MAEFFRMIRRVRGWFSRVKKKNGCLHEMVGRASSQAAVVAEATILPFNDSTRLCSAD